MLSNNNLLQPGHVLKSPNYSYRIERVLGVGGFGITYLASATVKVGNVSVKVNFAVKEHFMSSDCERDLDTSRVVYSNPAKDRVESSRKDFISEANRLRKVGIEHDNIVKVNEVFEANNTAYYVMEYLDGESLRKFVKRKGRLSEEEMLTIMTPIAYAVNYLHQARMTHLDIKPDNIMIIQNENGQVRPVLIDFGLSKHYDKDGRPTSTINILGCSDGYAPIEQYAGITTFSPAADIYSLGATMWFCLIGSDPKKSTELLEGNLSKSLPDNISDYVKNIIAIATAASRCDRKIIINNIKNGNLSNPNQEDVIQESVSESPVPTNVLSDNVHPTLLIGKDKKKNGRRNLTDINKKFKYPIIGIGVIIILGVLFFLFKNISPKEKLIKDELNDECPLTRPESSISDINNILSDTQKEMLTAINDSVSEASGLQIVSLILRNSYSNDFKAFNDSVFNSWGVGDSKLNNGVLLGIDVENKQIAVSIGSGISEPYINSKSFWELVVDSIQINCKRDDYFNALKKGSILAAKYKEFSKEPVIGEPVSEEYNVYPSNSTRPQSFKEKVGTMFKNEHIDSPDRLEESNIPMKKIDYSEEK